MYDNHQTQSLDSPPSGAKDRAARDRVSLGTGCLPGNRGRSKTAMVLRVVFFTSNPLALRPSLW